MTNPTPTVERVATMTDDQVKYMVDRFLGWRLPKDFNPDNGISATRPNYHPSVEWAPSGTNLFDASQAEAMVRYMIDGMPSATLRAEPLPDDDAAFFDKITGSVIDAYTLAPNDEDARRDTVNRCMRSLVLADRQRAVEAERDACEKIIEAYPAEEPFGREYEAGGLIRHGQNCAVRDILEAIRARAEQDTPANG